MFHRKDWILAGTMTAAFVAGQVAWSVGARRVAAAFAPRAPAVECLGDADAPAVAVYPHGLDTLGPAWVEIQNREALRVVARKARLRLALPRAPSRRWLHDRPRCAGRMKVLATVTEPEAVRKILTCIGVPARPPPVAPAREREQGELSFDG